MLWGGRFANLQQDELMHVFNDSLIIDRQLVEQDIQGSVAWASALFKAQVLTQTELTQLHGALKALQRDLQSNPESIPVSGAEDIHSWVESQLITRVGDLGKKLHTGRSRNDQVATDLKLWLKTAAIETLLHIRGLQQALLQLAEQHIDTVFPGYTHLQRAQPIRFAHWALAYVEMLYRDEQRIEAALVHMNQCPLGSGALAGTAYPIDRDSLARSLGFASATRNSLDAVSDRDFVLEIAAAASISQMHLSRLAEDVIFYASGEAALIHLGDAVSTGSSLMPQKRNPDVAELIRGKTGRIYAALQNLLVTMKGLPLSYNKDMQEDKVALFDCMAQWQLCLQMAAKLVSNIAVNADTALSAACGGYSNATELADYLVTLNMPFREAHHVVGVIVQYAASKKLPLEALSLDELQRFHPMINASVYDALSVEAALEKRAIKGGVARAQVQQQCLYWRSHLKGHVTAKQIRPANVHDVQAIVELVAHWAQEGENLPRTRADIVAHLQDFVVATNNGEVLGCAALFLYNEELAEIRSLGIWPKAQDQGLGKDLVKFLCARAQELGLKKVLSLTRVPRFFAKLGFVEDNKDKLPEKVLKDCLFCPKLHACDETAMIYLLS